MLFSYDVVEAVKFARDYNLSVTVLRSGHCYVGRSSGSHTLNINMKNMRIMAVNMDDLTSLAGYSITSKTGNNWGVLYEEV